MNTIMIAIEIIATITLKLKRAGYSRISHLHCGGLY